jgi:hypothetical protein
MGNHFHILVTGMEQEAQEATKKAEEKCQARKSFFRNTLIFFFLCVRNISFSGKTSNVKDTKR